jgi:hypothetical protein
MTITITSRRSHTLKGSQATHNHMLPSPNNDKRRQKRGGNEAKDTSKTKFIDVLRHVGNDLMVDVITYAILHV